ncbi:hypothetical protein [[Clostridium] fimetarium]|uniref:hypothetical protein n=1 Tax=[Clostridium] fimetarium TaxID=99656 RepID=UPI000B861886|nr:hypothetical protein [[Clostridium] fimetarium]
MKSNNINNISDNTLDDIIKNGGDTLISNRTLEISTKITITSSGNENIDKIQFFNRSIILFVNKIKNNLG